MRNADQDKDICTHPPPYKMLLSRDHSGKTHPLVMISGAAYAALPQNVKAFPPGASSNPVLANEKSTKIA